jgi:ubiquinone/menaquinone biosynthesis C-methylase UbiE
MVRNPGMLAMTTRLASGIGWRQGTAELLPYPNQSFDAVVSQFDLMFFSDRHQALLEMLRVLVPASHLAVDVTIGQKIAHIVALPATPK